MDETKLKALCERTDAKLRYAEVHLSELKEIPIVGGTDFDRAHQESFLYHLLGAKDAFILELNMYYGANLSELELSIGRLRGHMRSKGKRYSELTVIHQLETDTGSWLFHAKEMRDHSTHIANVSRAFYLGGQYDQQVHLTNPTTGKQIKEHFVELFSVWLSQMKNLIHDLRSNATANIIA